MAKHRENKKLQGCDGGGDGSDVTERHSDRSDIEERRGEESTSPPKGDERDVALATLLARKVVGNYPKHALTRLSPKAKNKRIQQWAEHVRKMRELDGHSESEIGHLIEWCQSDGFWKKNIQSTETLREKWDRLDADMQQGRSSAPKVIRIAEPGDDTPPLFRLPGAK